MKKISLVREELFSKEYLKGIKIFVITFERKLCNVILFQTGEIAKSHFWVFFWSTINSSAPSLQPSIFDSRLSARPPENTTWMNCTPEWLKRLLHII